MRNGKKVYSTKYYIRFITFLIFSLFTLVFRVKKKLPGKVKQLKSPYLLLSNHIGFFDPFVVGNILPHYTHFVASDAAFRNPVQRFFLTRLGTIPKKKNMRDTKVIKDIAAVIAQGENVGIFPEAVRNWAGSTFYIDESIAKLIKLLKVPVVLSIMKGMNLMNPRWSGKLRYTRLEVEYQLLLTPGQIQNLTPSDIISIVRKELVHDEVEHQRIHMNRIYSQKKAEHIGHALYLCPECNSIDTFTSKGNNFLCSECSYDIHIDGYGFFKRQSPGKLYFDNIRDWYNWQEQWLIEHVRQQLRNKSDQAILRDQNSIVYRSSGDDELKKLGIADIHLFEDRIEISFKNCSELLSLNFNDLQTINPQVGERLEIFYNNEAYRIEGGKAGVSALKWEVAVNAIWQQLGQIHKLSPYIKQSGEYRP
jgi:1-acyl-sn-glycerol-3-phosphate acyltransferase